MVRGLECRDELARCTAMPRKYGHDQSYGVGWLPRVENFQSLPGWAAFSRVARGLGRG